MPTAHATSPTPRSAGRSRPSQAVPAADQPVTRRNGRPPVVPPQRPPLAEILAALGQLDDAALHRAMTHAQSLLADRPAPPAGAGTADLRVEIVDGLEAHLLVAARALSPRGRQRLVALARQGHAPRRRRPRPPALAPS